MKRTRFASLVAFALLALPAGLSAGNDAANKAGDLKSHPGAIEEQITCTSYPEWTCFPSGAPAETRAARELEASRAAADPPACTSYPEWTCFPEVNKAPSNKVAQAKQAKQRPTKESKTTAVAPGREK